ncbi:MAG: zinc ribbon domain-containing protein, partial [Actinomycetota bacterium]
MTICRCGRSNEAEARFCQDCGRRLHGASETTGEGDDILLLDGRTGAAQDPMTARVQSGRPVWLPVGALLLAVAAIWGVLSIGGGSEPTTSPDAAADDASATNPDASDDEASNEDADPAPSDDDPEDEREEDQTEPTTGPSSTVEADEDSSVGDDAAPAVPRPVLDQAIGLDLLVSTRGRPAILDLDTGEITYHEGNRLYPVGISGGWLVSDGRTPIGATKVPLDDLSASATAVFGDGEQVFASALPFLGDGEPGQLWFATYRQLAEASATFLPSVELIDLASGEAVPHPLAEEGIQSNELFAGRFSEGSGGLLTGPSGGVYAATDTGFRLVTDGNLIAADAERVLVETCDETLRCQRRWLDRRTWEPLDLVAPDPEAVVTAVVSPTDWVLTVTLV